MESMYKDISILIIGFDGYKDVWDHCIDLLNTNWKDRPKTYLACSELQPQYEGVEVINAGADAEWSKKVQIALNHISTPYVLLLLEDFFISDKVDTAVISEAVELIKQNDIRFYQVLVQLVRQTAVKGAAFEGNKRIHIIPQNKRYAINLQAAIWNVEFLKEVVGTENYNAWQFEVRHLQVQNINQDKIQYLIDDRNIFNITHAVVQSKYLPGALKKLRKKGYYIDENEREVLSKKDNFKYMLKLFMYGITPEFMVKTFKKIGRLMKIDFVTDRVTK